MKVQLLKRQPHKIVKPTRTIRRQFADESCGVFDHLVGQVLNPF